MALPDKSHQLFGSPGPAPLGWDSGHSWYALLRGEEEMGWAGKDSRY